MCEMGYPLHESAETFGRRRVDGDANSFLYAVAIGHDDRDIDPLPLSVIEAGSHH